MLHWWMRWENQVETVCFFYDMELLNDFGRVLDPLDGGSIGQQGAPQPGARTVKAAWSMPGLTGELESFFAENLEQLSKGEMEVGGYPVCGRRGFWFGSLESEAAPVQFPGDFPPF